MVFCVVCGWVSQHRLTELQSVRGKREREREREREGLETGPTVQPRQGLGMAGRRAIRQCSQGPSVESKWLWDVCMREQTKRPLLKALGHSPYAFAEIRAGWE